MMKHNNFKISLTLPVIFIILLSVTSCNRNAQKGQVILTRTSFSKADPDYITGEGWRYIENASIVAFNTDKPGKPVKILTGDFMSARSPEISYDGRSMLFSGKLGENDPWQIWEMNLSNLKFKRVTNLPDNCTDPAYLPGSRLVFSRMSENDAAGTCHYLYTCNLDGTDLRQITYHPHADFAAMVLSDGRILSVTRQVYPDEGESMIYVMRPDGTKADKYIGSQKGNSYINKVCEGKDRNIYLIESGQDYGKGGSLFSVNQNRPLFTRRRLSSDTGSFISVAVKQSGDLLVAYKPADTDMYGLYSFDPTVGKEPQPLYAEAGYNILEVAVAEEHEKPRKLPSEVDLLVKTGQIMCQDINVLGPETSKNGIKARKIEILGIGTSLGTVETSEDGSFYLKPLANVPFRIQTVDGNGKVVNGPSGWMWVRPNERRGCIGCHEDPELVPENRIPLAVKIKPVNIPVHVTKVKEKSVELE